MSKLVRTDNGTVVHLAICAVITHPNPAPWIWAEGRGAVEIHLAMAMIGARACEHCNPMEDQ